MTRDRPASARADLLRRLAAELLGTGLLVTVVIGSGIAASRLSPHDVGLQLLENSVATALGLTAVILMFGTVSGAHVNPVVSLADWLVGRRTRTGISLPHAGLYIATTERATWPHLLGEVVATAGLLLLVFALVRTGRGALAAPTVGAYIGSAYWFTSSTSFANPAVTIGRVFSDTFAGIAPGSVLPFLVAQLIGGLVGAVLAVVLFPDVGRSAGDIVIPSDTERP